jgi:hypothetical protein
VADAEIEARRAIAPRGEPTPPESTAVRAGLGWIEQMPLALLLIFATSAYT